MPEEELVGEVFRYYDDKGIACLKLSSKIVIGETLHFKDPDGDFFQTIEEMEVSKESAHFAYAGDYVCIKVEKKLREHDQVFMQI